MQKPSLNAARPDFCISNPRQRRANARRTDPKTDASLAAPKLNAKQSVAQVGRQCQIGSQGLTVHGYGTLPVILNLFQDPSLRALDAETSSA